MDFSSIFQHTSQAGSGNAQPGWTPLVTQIYHISYGDPQEVKVMLLRISGITQSESSICLSCKDGIV